MEGIASAFSARGLRTSLICYENCVYSVEISKNKIVIYGPVCYNDRRVAIIPAMCLLH